MEYYEQINCLHRLFETVADADKRRGDYKAADKHEKDATAAMKGK
jgi:hypothetical protein